MLISLLTALGHDLRGQPTSVLLRIITVLAPAVRVLALLQQLARDARGDAPLTGGQDLPRVAAVKDPAGTLGVVLAVLVPSLPLLLLAVTEVQQEVLA